MSCAVLRVALSVLTRTISREVRFSFATPCTGTEVFALVLLALGARSVSVSAGRNSFPPFVKEDQTFRGFFEGGPTDAADAGDLNAGHATADNDVEGKGAAVDAGSPS